MIHGTPSEPDIDGVSIDQDEGDNAPWWFYLVILLILGCIIYLEVKYPGTYDGSGNLTR